MIIQCKSCSRKFIVKDSDIPKKGRSVQCGYCSVSWHQMPIKTQTKTIEKTKVIKSTKEPEDSLSVENIKASDGKTYKFLGSQWAELLPSGKTGLFAKKKIGKELDKLTGRKEKESIQKKPKKTKKEIDPLSESKEGLPEIYKSKEGLGFFGFLFLLIIVGFSIVGILKTFENDLLNYFPQMQYIYDLLEVQLEFISETVKNMITIFNDLIDSY